MRKRAFITIFGFAISVVLLYFALKGIEFREIWATLKKTKPAFAFIPVIFIACAISLSSYKWSKIAGTNVRFRETFVAMLIGMFANNVLPARLGEGVRGYMLSRKKNLSFTYSFATVVLDRFFDLTGLLLLTLLFFPRARLPHAISEAIYVIIGVLLFCVFMIIVLSRESFANRLSAKFTTIEKSFLSRFAKRIIEVQENLRRIRSPLTIVYLVIISGCAWLSMSIALYFVILALGIHSISFRVIPFVCALLNFGISIPSSPGYVGVYQFLLVYLLSIFGVPKYEGFTISVLYHASWYIPYTVVGFFFSLREHLRVRDIRGLKAEDTTPRNHSIFPK
jgi:glycosyltransferase 2 family protein